METKEKQLIENINIDVVVQIYYCRSSETACMTCNKEPKILFGSFSK